VDLGIKPLGSKPPCRECPHCKALLLPAWWQRCVWVAVSLFLTFAVPAALGIRDLMGLLLAGLICEWPALIYGYILVFKVMPPKYVCKPEVVMTLFQR
jgi:hypothetical protein